MCIELGYADLVTWAGKRRWVVSKNTMGSFFTKKLKEDKCKQIIPHLKQFLVENIRTRPENRSLRSASGLSRETEIFVDGCKETMKVFGRH